MKTKFLFLILGIATLLSGCKHCNDKKNTFVSNDKPSDTATSPKENVIADTIIYDVKIKNPNSEDLWTEKYLKNIEEKRFIDQLFEDVYSGKLIAYDYFSHKQLRPKDLIKMEEKGEIDRNKIGKIQFVETWYYDSENSKITKNVISLTLGSEITDSEGNIIAYRSVFKVYLN